MTDRQNERLTGKQANRLQANGMTDGRTDKQTDKQTGGKADGWMDKLTDRLTDEQTDTHADDRQTDRQTGLWNDGRTDKQAHRLTDRLKHRLRVTLRQIFGPRCWNELGNNYFNCFIFVQERIFLLTKVTNFVKNKLQKMLKNN